MTSTASSAQIDVIQRMYNAKGDMDVIRAVIAQDAVWDIAVGFPKGGVYSGFDNIINDFFSFFGDFSEFWAEGDEFFEVGDHVIALGRYHGVTKDGGNQVTSRFVHIYTLRDGQIIRLQQTTDTLLIARALGRG
ncbi:SnoaL-like domain-containing protein [Pseudomonas sp. ADAK18]|uniref:nuclear transport factor 2 family protein n=1 Tax=Pseudomonas sp. ADAK18 TaxID=2730848 RepID=UPI0014636D56|nr:nuclear transport factor 2 family protein [Pseudomonas sp. ADAK18]QJI29011.1 SnoaL-like domain-containing protein [Pseudomonas sp. ADAK18]